MSKCTLFLVKSWLSAGWPCESTDASYLRKACLSKQVMDLMFTLKNTLVILGRFELHRLGILCYLSGFMNCHQ